MDYPTVSYTARLEMSDSEIISLMSIRYSAHAPHQVSWSAIRYQVRRHESGTVEYVDGVCERSVHTYPCHIDAIEAGVNHFLRAASVERGQESM